MEIDSEQYYGIVLNQNYEAAGENLLQEISEALQANGNAEEADDVLKLGLPGYSVDVRCLIGFALTHDSYYFGIGGLSHVLGHQLRPSIKTVVKHTETLQHKTHEQILRMLDAMLAVSSR